MELRVSDGVVLVYTYAVVVSGWLLVTRFGFQDRLTLLALSAVIAIGWTVYFRFGVAPKLSSPTGDDSEEEPGG